MPDDLRTLLESADAPSMRVDPHRVLEGGRRRHRRRTGLASAALAVTVGVLAVGAAAAGDLGTGVLRPAPASSASTPTTPRVPASSATSDPTTRAVAQRVVLDVGHCWLEDVVFDGQTWGLTERQQLGTGGGMPRGWRGRGLMVRLSGDRARYTDDGGKVLTFLPVEDPTVFRPRVCA